MATVDWAAVENPNLNRNRPKYDTANITFENSWDRDDKSKPKPDGTFEKIREVIVSIQHPGTDKTPVLWKHLPPNEQAELQSKYDAWEKGETIPLSGTPLSSWSLMPRAIYEQFVKGGVHTLEQLVTLVDNTQNGLPPELKPWPKKAKEFVKAAGSTQAQVAAANERAERAEEKAARYEEQIAQMQRRIEAGGL